MLQEGLLAQSRAAGASNSVLHSNINGHSNGSEAGRQSLAGNGASSNGNTSIASDYIDLQLPKEDSIMAASRVVSLGSFSKIMAPGLRLG